MSSNFNVSFACVPEEPSDKRGLCNELLPAKALPFSHGGKAGTISEDTLEF